MRHALRLHGKWVSSMFSGASLFDKPIGKQSVPAGVKFSHMFNGAGLLNHDREAGTLPKAPTASAWSTTITPAVKAVLSLRDEKKQLYSSGISLCGALPQQ